MRGLPGSIDICVENFTFDLTSARFDLNLRAGRNARITFSDTGHGMDAATKRRIFEPFLYHQVARRRHRVGHHRDRQTRQRRARPAHVTEELRIEAAATGVRALFSKPVDMEELRDLLQELVPPSPSLEAARTKP